MVQQNLSIDDLVALKVKEELAKYDKRHIRISDGWLKLRKEISDYINFEMRDATGMGFYACQKVFYDPIKAVTGVGRIDELSDEQVEVANEVFVYLRRMIARYNHKGG